MNAQTRFTIKIYIHQKTPTGAFLWLFPAESLPPSNTGFEQSTKVSDLIRDPRVWGIFRNHHSESKKPREVCVTFFFFQKLVLGESSSLSAHQLQLFSSVLGWPLHGFCCQGPGLLGSIGGAPAARHGYDADIHADWD